MFATINTTFLKLLATGMVISFTAARAQADLSLGSYVNKTYRSLKTPTGYISVPNFKKTNQSSLVFTNKDYSLVLKIRNGRQLLELNRKHKEKKYSVFVSGNKVGSFVEKLKTQFNPGKSSLLLCQSKQSPEKKLLTDLKTSIQDLAYSDGFINETCLAKLDATEQVKILDLVANELTPETSYLMKCLNSETTKNYFKNPEVPDDFGLKVFSAFTQELENIENGTSQLKLNCSENESHANYTPNQSINLPVVDGSILVDRCKNSSQIFVHEFFHHAGLSDESAGKMDTLCAKALDIPTVKELNCKDSYPAISDDDGGPTAAALLAAKAAEGKIETAAVQNIIKKEINTAAFVPVQDADIQELAQPTSKANFERSANRVSSAMSKNLELMAGPLNKAIAATVTPAGAVASEATLAKVQKEYSNDRRSPASNSKKNNNKEYVVEEILADKYDLPVETVRAMAAKTEAKPETPPTRTLAATPAKTTVAKVQSLGNEIAGTNTNSGSAAATNPGASLRPTSSPARSNTARGPSSVAAPAVRAPSTPNPEKTAQELRYFNEVRGDRYRKVQQLYSDPSFAAELKTQSIAIEFKKNNRTLTIGDTTSQREKLFNDDGTALRQKK